MTSKTDIKNDNYLNPDQLPSLIESLLTPLDNDSIDDEKLEATLLKNVLLVSKIVKHAIFNNILKYDDIKKDNSMQPSSPKKRKKMSKRDIINANFIKEQYKSFVGILIEWLNLPSSNYVDFQVLALNTLLEMTKRHEQENIFDNSLFSRIIRNLMISANFSAELAVTLLQEYTNKYGDAAYYTFKNLRVLVMENVKGYESKKINKINAAIVARNSYNLLSRMVMPMSDDLLFQSFVGADPIVTENEGTDVANNKDSSSSEDEEEENEDSDDDDEDSDDDDDDNHENLSTKRIQRPKWASLSYHKKEFSKTWCGLLRLPLSDKIYRAVLKKLPGEIIPHMVNPILLSDFLTASCDKGGEAGLLALSGMYELIAKYNFDYPSFYNKIYAMITPDLFYAQYRSHFFQKLALFMTSSRLPLATVASFSKRLARLSLNGPPSGALFSLPLIFNMFKRHPKCIIMIHCDKKTKQAGTDDDDDKYKDNVTAADTFNNEETDPSKTNAINTSLWEVEALQKHPNPSVSTLAKRFNQSFSKKAYNMNNFCSSTYKDMFDRQINRRINKEPATNFNKPEGIFSDSKYFTTGFTF